MQWLKCVFQIWTKVNDFCANISQQSLVLFWSIKPLGPQWKRNSWKMVKMKQRNNLSECCFSIRKMLFSISKNIESNIFIYKNTFPSPDFSCGGTFHTFRRKRWQDSPSSCRNQRGSSVTFCNRSPSVGPLGWCRHCQKRRCKSWTWMHKVDYGNLRLSKRICKPLDFFMARKFCDVFFFKVDFGCLIGLVIGYVLFWMWSRRYFGVLAKPQLR